MRVAAERSEAPGGVHQRRVGALATPATRCSIVQARSSAAASSCSKITSTTRDGPHRPRAPQGACLRQQSEKHARLDADAAREHHTRDPHLERAAPPLRAGQPASATISRESPSGVGGADTGDPRSGTGRKTFDYAGARARRSRRHPRSLSSGVVSGLEASGRSIVDDNLYIVLATADADGRPFASPAVLRVRGLHGAVLGLVAGGDAIAHPRREVRAGHRRVRLPDADQHRPGGLHVGGRRAGHRRRAGAGHRDLLAPDAVAWPAGMDGGGRERARAATAVSRDGVCAVHARQERRGAAVRPPHPMRLTPTG